MASLRFWCVSVFLVLVLLACSLQAIPLHQEETQSHLGGFVRRILADLGVKPTAAKSHNRVIRQAIMCTDTNNTACLPDDISQVPMTLIQCSGGDFCICNECFERGSDGRCQLNSCEQYFYDESNRECVDDRPSQLTAFLLSLFLSSTGAANFYIGQDGLGAGQLTILVVLLIASYSMCYIPCCLLCCMEKDSMKGSICFILFMLVAFVVIFACALGIWAWWIADVIIFATNQREDGNGCELTPDL